MQVRFPLPDVSIARIIKLGLYSNFGYKFNETTVSIAIGHSSLKGEP
ncbi:hypothetical protein VDG1235_4842 [Verrucomicrobiia bacterium DG1235]|nr:hypothetical protein VDG1235_4842 [Verrucomicrobiae bacterium DG1235]